MPYIKLLTVLAGLALLTACGGGGGTAETPDTAGGNATDCKTNAFHADCNADAPAIELRQSMCLADDSADSTCGVVITGACEANPFRTETACMADTYNDDRETACLADIMEDDSCRGTTGLATVFCEANPFDTATACGHDDYDDERQTMCLADIMKDDSCRGEMGIATLFCEANPFDTATPCMHGDYADERQTACLADIMKDDSCRGDMGIATLFCEANPFDTATPCMHGDYADERQTMCLANIAIDDSCRGTTGIATLFCEANPFDTATPCGHGDYADERQTMCLANIMIDDSCRGDMGIATVFCKANWFDTSNACTADTYLPLRVADCITAGNAGESKCNTISTDTAMNTAITDCLTNPFATACESVSAFTSFALARANRVSFCASNSGELCTVLTACQGNPFGTGCEAYFEPLKATYCMNNPMEAPCVVNTADWVASFGAGKAPPTRLDNTVTATDRQRQFLTGLATVTNGKGLDTMGAVNILANIPLTLDSARYNGEPLGGAGDEKDGYGLFIDTVAVNTWVVYAGLLSDTDLGAPLTQTTGSVTWYGQIQIFRDGGLDTTPAHDFELKITFGANPAVDGSVGSIEGGDVERAIGSNTHQYHVAGTYDAGGVITGTTTYVGFSGSDTGQLSRATPDGILTGLIGAQGAVGVFLSGNAGSTKDNIIGAANASGRYGGGFVVAPYVPAEDDDASKVTFRDWLREFNYPLPTSSAVEIARTTSKPHFIRPKTDGTLDLTGVTGTTQHKATRAGDDKDGFAYGVGKIVTASTPAGISHNFVGILPSTDLGAPLTEAIAIAKWPGQFSFGNSATLNDIEFTLTFDGTNSGTIDGMFGVVRFDLVFDGKGIITGDVTYSLSGTNPTTTVARGLIGAEGLVGVFTNINNGNTAGVEFGGFVADYVAPSVATYATFKTYYADSARTDERTLYATPTTTDSRGAFVEGTATGLPTDGFTFTSGNFAPVTVRLKKAVSGNDGFVLMYGNVSSGLDTRRFRAGLLPTTDLGPAVPTTSTANWAGSLHLGLAGGGVRNVDLPTVTVDFANGRITAPETEVGVGTGNTVTINGLFGAGLPSGTPAGILGGTVNFDFSGNPHTDRPLIGLIGTKGAIGVFHGVGLTLIGGFQASPN